MDENLVTKFVIGAVSGVLGFASSVVIAWLTIRSKGMTATDAAEIADRGQFRLHLMGQIKELVRENKDLRAELEKWRGRVYTLEEQVRKLVKKDFIGKG